MASRFKEVKELVSAQDYSNAHSLWSCAMFESHFNVHAPFISTEFFKGITLVVSAELFLEGLEKEDQRMIRFNMGILESCVAQYSLAKQTNHPLL